MTDVLIDGEGHEIGLGDSVHCEHEDEFGPIELEAEIVRLFNNGKLRLRGEGRMGTLYFTLPATSVALARRVM